MQAAVEKAAGKLLESVKLFDVYKGKGIPELNGRGRGDQYVTVYIETPRNLNREQKEALKKFAESVGDNNYEERRKFFKKFKK